MKKFLLLSVSVVFLFYSCDSAKIVKNSGSENAKELQKAKRWLLTEGQNTVNNYKNDPIFIKFPAEGAINSMSGFAGCNDFGVQLNVTSNNFQVNSTASNLNYCPDKSKEDNFLDMLANANNWKIQGDELKLYHDQLELLTFKADN